MDATDRFYARRQRVNKKGGKRLMKAFLEEYGVIVVAAIVIMIIVVFATPAGTSIKTGIETAIKKLTDKLGQTAEING